MFKISKNFLVTNYNGLYRIKSFKNAWCIWQYKLQSILSRFICPQNRMWKISYFRKQSDLPDNDCEYLPCFEEESPVLVGYFTLPNKFVSIHANSLSKTLQKRIRKLYQYDKKLNRFLVSIPLIAQLGRNFDPPYLPIYLGKNILHCL